MKIALVELSESHEECLFTQISFLKKDKNEISLFIHPKIENQISYGGLVNKISIINFDELSGFKSLMYQFNLVKELGKFDKVIFNTASSSKQLRNIVFFLLFYKVECIGVIHDVKKLQKSFTQKIISFKIKKYFTLSDFLKKNAIISNAKVRLETYYPIYFPEFETKNIKKKSDELWFCIPGRVELERRDYFFLIEELKKETISKDIKFLILGNINTKDGLLFKNVVEQNNFESNFIFFTQFIPNDLYYSYIHASDYVLPLLKKEDTGYLKHKISGTFNLAYSFKKILFCNHFYSVISDLKENGIFYSEENFINIINIINSLRPRNSYSNKKWNYDFQYQKFINFINS